MKQLILVGNQKVKFQDTETTISLTLVSDGNTVTIDKSKTYSVKIKNGTGYVKAIDATPDTINNMVTFKTSGFNGLPVDAYFIELWVIDKSGQTIYPSDSFIELDITANATGVQGQVVPAITLQEFEDRFKNLQTDLEAKVGTLVGPIGKTGNGINTVVTEYQLSSSGSDVPKGSWSQSPVTPTDTLPYMWTRNVTTYTDKSTHVSYNISAKGTQGNNFTIQGHTSSVAGLPHMGTDGEGYMVGTELYVWTNGKWNDTVDMKGVQGDKGIQGIQGVKGATGTGISSVTTEYELSKQGTSIPNTGWSSTLLAMTNDLPYLWTRVTINFTDGSKNMVYFTSNKGDKGDTGARGDKGDTGANLAVKGAIDKATSLPSSDNTEGDAYLVGTDLYVYTNKAWKNCGPIVAENTVLYNADGSLNVKGTRYNYVQDLRNGKIQYNNGTKNIELTPVDSQKEAEDILSAHRYTDDSISSLSSRIDTKLSGYATNSQLATKADDSKVVHSTDMRKPASDVAGIEEVNTKQDKIGYTPADDSKVVHYDTIPNSLLRNYLTSGTDLNTITSPGIFPFNQCTFVNDINSAVKWGELVNNVLPNQIIRQEMIIGNGQVYGYRIYNAGNETWSSWLIPADDSKVAHLSGANNFDTVPTVKNNPLLLASSLPSDLARTGQANTFSSLQTFSQGVKTLQTGSYSDANLLVNEGLYYNTNSSIKNGARYLTTGYIQVMSGYGEIVRQIMYSDTNGGVIYDRTSQDGGSSWGNWVQIVSWDQIPGDLAFTDQDANFTAKLQKNGQDVALANNTIYRNPDTGSVSEANTFTAQQTFSIAPIDETTGHPYITKDGVPAVPSTLADTTKDANFTAKLQKSGVDVATTSDVSNAVSGATSQVAHLSGTNNFTGPIQHNGNPVGAHIQASKNDEGSAISDSAKGNSDDIYYWYES